MMTAGDIGVAIMPRRALPSANMGQAGVLAFDSLYCVPNAIV